MENRGLGVLACTKGRGPGGPECVGPQGVAAVRGLGRKQGRAPIDAGRPLTRTHACCMIVAETGGEQMLLRTMILVPIADNARQPYPAETWRELRRKLVDTIGGYSNTGVVRGAWRDGETVYTDASQQIIVSLESVRQIPQWLEIVEWVLREFRQEAVYVEIAGTPEILGRLPD